MSGNCITSGYYGYVRSEIGPLLPGKVARILDVGCGAGRTSAWLKTLYPGSHTIGLEGNQDLLPELSKNVDEPHIVDLNGPWPELGRVDLVLLLDVLEHLVNPQEALSRAAEILEHQGLVIISLPNVAHFSVSLPLLFLGRFDYTDAGILDRTHLHFFHRESALDLVRKAGLSPERGLLSGVLGRKTRLIDRMTFGLMRDRLAKQYIFSARHREHDAQLHFKWNPI